VAPRKIKIKKLITTILNIKSLKRIENFLPVILVNEARSKRVYEKKELTLEIWQEMKFKKKNSRDH
jgi:hypothetical protein